MNCSTLPHSSVIIIMFCASSTDYFTKVTGGGVPNSPDAVYDSSYTGSVGVCASACYNANFVCNSFYFCSGSVSQCLLSKANVPTGPDAKKDVGCQPYSRK